MSILSAYLINPSCVLFSASHRRLLKKTYLARENPVCPANMYQKLLLMSLLSLLFGCGNKSKNKGKYPEVPHFPQTDNPACRLEPVAMDSGFFAQAFIISPDKQSVFVLAYGMEGTPDRMPYQLLRLDAGGRIQSKMVMPDSQWENAPCFWWEDDGKLTLMFSSVIGTFDPVGMKAVKEWQQVDIKNFLPQKRLDQLTYDEQDTAYREAMEKAVGKSRSACVLQVLNLHFLLLDTNGKVLQAWYLKDDEDIERFTAKFGLRKGAQYGAQTADDDAVSDGNTRISTLAREMLDYKIAYPDLKYIGSRTLALSMGNQTARFKLSNKDNHSMNLQYSDNQYLTTADSTIWLMYERQLYRVRMGR